MQSAAGTDSDGWDITHDIPTGGPVTRVSTITAPDSGNPATNPATPTPWIFRSSGTYTGTPAESACLTDPRAGRLCSPGSSSPRSRPVDLRAALAAGGEAPGHQLRLSPRDFSPAAAFTLGFSMKSM